MAEMFLSSLALTMLSRSSSRTKARNVASKSLYRHRVALQPLPLCALSQTRYVPPRALAPLFSKAMIDLQYAQRARPVKRLV